MKAVIQLLMAMFAAVVPVLGASGQPLGLTDWINVGVIAAGAATVYIAGNDETGIWSITKLFMSLVSAVGVVLISVLGDMSVSSAEWIQIGAAVLAVLSVYEFPKGLPTIGGNEAPGKHEVVPTPVVFDKGLPDIED